MLGVPPVFICHGGGWTVVDRGDCRSSAVGPLTKTVAVVARTVLITMIAFNMFAGAAHTQVGGAYPAFTWGARFKATFLQGVAFNDAFAPLYNPAAVRGCTARHMSVEQIRPFGVPVTAVGWCGRALGGHLILRQTPSGLGFDYNTYTLGATGTWRAGLGAATFSVGLTPKLLFVSIAGTDSGYDDEAFGYSSDVGIGVDVPSRSGNFDLLSINVAALDVASRLRYGSGAVEQAAAPVYTAALSVAWPRLVVGVGGRQRSDTIRWRIGAEYTLRGQRLAADVLEHVALRAGIGADEAAVGLGVALRGFRIDYAYLLKGNGLGDAERHALSTRLHF